MSSQEMQVIAFLCLCVCGVIVYGITVVCYAWKEVTKIGRLDDYEEKRIKFDRETERWFNLHFSTQTTVCRCEKCGLLYKPELGHKCKEGE